MDITTLVGDDLLTKYREIADDKNLDAKIEAFKYMYDHATADNQQKILAEINQHPAGDIKRLHAVLNSGQQYYETSKYGEIQKAGGAEAYIKALEQKVKEAEAQSHATNTQMQTPPNVQQPPIQPQVQPQRPPLGTTKQPNVQPPNVQFANEAQEELTPQMLRFKEAVDRRNYWMDKINKLPTDARSRMRRFFEQLENALLPHDTHKSF